MLIDGLQDPHLTEKESESWRSKDQNRVTLMYRPRAPQTGWGEVEREREGRTAKTDKAASASHSRELQH